jgi:uncharacterized protein (DUF427 family)
MTDTTSPGAAPSAPEYLILGRMTLEPAGRRLRAVFRGETVAESDDALVLAETGCPPRVYFPPESVRMDLLTPTAHTSHCPWKGDAAYWTLTVGDARRENGAWAYPEPLAELAAIAGYLSFYEDVTLEG